MLGHRQCLRDSLVGTVPLQAAQCTYRRRLRSALRATADGESVGDNFLGKAIKQSYKIGGSETIRWGVLKSNVEAPQEGGKAITWEQYRRETEADRQRLRETFAENLEVISYQERDRRRLVGLVVGAATLLAAGAMIANHAPWGQRLWLYPGVAFAIAFIDSSIQGLCTESMAGAWDVDDTGLEYIPDANLAQRIQQKVIKMYLRDFALAVSLMGIICAL